MSNAKLAVKGPGLKVPGVVVLQFLLIFIFEALEYLEMQCIIEHRDGVNSIKIIQNNKIDIQI